MLQQGEPVAYVQRQLGHASIQLTVDTYGKWLPMQSQAAVDRLDAPFSESGSKMVATVREEPAKYWSWREELNLQPVVYKTTALPLSYASQLVVRQDRRINLRRNGSNCAEICQGIVRTCHRGEG